MQRSCACPGNGRERAGPKCGMQAQVLGPLGFGVHGAEGRDQICASKGRLAAGTQRVLGARETRDVRGLQEPCGQTCGQGRCRPVLLSFSCLPLLPWEVIRDLCFFWVCFCFHFCFVIDGLTTWA